ncbi:MAG: hypothetical protein ABI602_01730 [Candidatus Saccharibacteria bacterium]
MVLLSLLDLFARGGGGGSGGGGGGGGGGVGGGSGGNSGIGILLVGYVPTHFLGALLRRKALNRVSLAAMVGLTLAYAVLLFSIGGWFIAAGLAALVGGPIGYFGAVSYVAKAFRKKAAQDLAVAAKLDSAWDPVALEARVRTVFADFQSDWSNFQVEHMKTYLTPDYAEHMRLVMAAIGVRQRRNLVKNPTILELFPVEVTDAPQDDQDRIRYYVRAQADDQLLETINGQENLLFEDKNIFTEYWRFVRINTSWCLEGIDEATVVISDGLAPVNTIKRFASANGLYYSDDWGWLLLPRRGLLFAKGKFGVSDINNHAIGLYRNVLVELYRYSEGQASDSKTYTIAQAALPKRYDSLSVQAKAKGFGGLFTRTPRGYNRLSLEWPDFNRRYTVYATNVEQVTVFELLHPVYMEKLFALKFKVSIEVVDNVVFLYSADPHADYNTMFKLLKDAFEEMKL